MQMRRLVPYLVMGVLLSTPAWGAPRAQEGSSARTAVRSASDLKMLLRALLDAWETRDKANAAPFYVKDSQALYFDTLPFEYKGLDELTDGVEKLLSIFSTIKFKINDDVQPHLQGRSAWAVCTFSGDGTTKGGADFHIDGRWTVIWEKQGKEWLVAHEHVSVPAPPFQMTPPSLYKRLGGYDALAAVTDDFIGRLASDPQLAKFFAGHSKDSLHRIRQLVVDQLCEATGGPCVYVGRDMKTSHAGLGITENDWQAAANHLVETLNKFNVPAKEKDEVLGAISNLKKDIVE